MRVVRMPVGDADDGGKGKALPGDDLAVYLGGCRESGRVVDSDSADGADA